MSTYDASWARKVYSQYAKLCTRAQQINMCIRQTAKDYRPFELSTEAVVEALTWWIRHKSTQQYWNRYKRLCRVTPLDEELLISVTRELLDVAYEVDVEKKQRQFDFLDNS